MQQAASRAPNITENVCHEVHFHFFLTPALTPTPNLVIPRRRRKRMSVQARPLAPLKQHEQKHLPGRPAAGSGFVRELPPSSASARLCNPAWERRRRRATGRNVVRPPAPPSPTPSPPHHPTNPHLRATSGLLRSLEFEATHLYARHVGSSAAYDVDYRGHNAWWQICDVTLRALRHRGSELVRYA